MQQQRIEQRAQEKRHGEGEDHPAGVYPVTEEFIDPAEDGQEARDDQMPAQMLASHPRKIFSAQNIYESIWNEPYFYTSNNLVMVHIRNIRRKLGDDPQNCHTIRTVWGKGYCIE